jgi:hypothetical protein
VVYAAAMLLFVARRPRLVITYINCAGAIGSLSVSKLELKTKLRGLSQRANYTDRATAALSAKLVPIFADRWCRAVSVTDPLAVLSAFRPQTLLFLPNSSSLVLTRLSGPRCRPTTFQRIL